MNLVGMLCCVNEHCFNLGVIRMSTKKIVNISHGGHYIRPYVHRGQLHSSNTGHVLTKDQLHEQILSLKCIDSQWNKNVYLSSSGGSGGKRLFFATDIRQNQLQRQILVQLMLEEKVIRADDVCLNLFTSNNMYRSFEIFNDFCSIANCTTLPMGHDTQDEDILDIIEYFKPNVLMGSPYRLMQLALFIETKNIVDIHFEKIFFAGESLDRIKEETLRRVLHCSIYLGFYGSAETGVFACQSPAYSSTEVYMYPKRLVHLETVDSKLVVTNLIRKRNQLMRFAMGDLGRVIDERTNESYGLIEVQQSERLILTEQGQLSKSDIETTMKQYAFVEWQLIVDRLNDANGNQLLLLFRYVPSESIDNALLRQRLEKNLQKCFQAPWISISGHVRLQLESITFDQLIRSQTSNKLLKIIDRRIGLQ